MSLVNRRTLISAVVALLVGLAIYGIAQGSDLLPLGAQPAPQPAPQEEAPEAAAPAVVQQEMTIPSGAVWYFDLPACPDGWTELTAAKGRYVVGLPSSGTLAGTIGTPLAAQENRAVGQHTHTVSDPGHGHTVSDPGHSHVATDIGHTHSISDPGHQHNLANDPGVLVYGDRWGDGNGSPNFGNCIDDLYSNDAYTGIEINTGYANITVDSNSTGISVNNRTTGITVDDAGSVAGTNAPYIQLLVCQKN